MKKALIPGILMFVLFSSILSGQEEEPNVEIEPTKLRENIYMLTGKGGNMGVLFGDDRAFLIDDQFAPLTEKIRNTIHEIKDVPVEFVLNTHWHPDHTGGNEKFGETGSIIVAHKNVRKRLKEGQAENYFGKSVEPAPKEALPVVTFTDDISFHLGDETTSVFHLPNAHTDGDVAIHFKSSNVIHAGDVFFNQNYPFIDITVHGSVEGTIEAAKKILKMADENTKIIPGHGPLGTRSDLKQYIRMLKSIRATIHQKMNEGKDLEQIQSERPTKSYDDPWGNGFISPDQFVEIVYKSIKKQTK